jgi:protein-S-isoprenylcysteine O-methyltransferase Ste14
MLQLIYAYLVLAAFFMVELILRKNGTAKNLGETKSDSNSTLYVIISLFTVLSLSVISNLLKIGAFDNETVSKIALILMVLGLFMRVWSMITLKKSYTRTLLTTENQTVIKSGPYKIIRHPGYLGTILIWCFAGPAMQNIVVSIVAPMLIIPAYSYRILNEEKMLAERFGELYKDYIIHSWRLIPFVW